MPAYQFVALRPDFEDRYNLWVFVRAECFASGKSVEDALACVSTHPVILGAYELYVCEVSVVPEECAPESKVARLDFRHWCNEDPEGKRFRLVARGAESFDEYDERRFSASHLEKRVIDNRPPVHLALDALEQEAPNRLMGSVLEFATREQRAVLKSALLGRVSLATMESLGALGMSVMEYRQMVLEFSRESMAG